VLLTEIHVCEGEVAVAIEAVRQASMAGGFPCAYGSEPLSTRVALAAEPDFPRETIALSTSAAERLSQAQSRDNYTTATRSGACLRSAPLAGGSSGVGYADRGIREQNRRLRALKEELDRAGL